MLIDKLERDMLASAKVTWEQPCWLISRFPTDDCGWVSCIRRDNTSCCLVGVRQNLAQNCSLFMDCGGAC